MILCVLLSACSQHEASVVCSVSRAMELELAQGKPRGVVWPRTRREFGATSAVL